MSVGELCNREVVMVEGGAAIGEAAALMREYHVGDLVVVERRGQRSLPIGMLTDRDLVVEVLAEGVNTDSVSVVDVMSDQLVTVAEDDETLSAVEHMVQGGVRRAPVVDAGGGLVGILAFDDLIDLFAEQLSDLARLVARERRSEQHRSRGHGPGVD